MTPTCIVTGSGGLIGSESARYFASQGYRVIGTGPEGIFNIPPNIASRFPAGIHVRVIGMNGYGKVYTADRNFQLNR